MNVTYSDEAKKWDEKTGLLTLTNQYIEEILHPEVTEPILVHWKMEESDRPNTVNAIMTIRNPDGESVRTLYPESFQYLGMMRVAVASSLNELLGLKLRRMVRSFSVSEVE